MYNYCAITLIRSTEMMITMIADIIVLRETIYQLHLELSFCSFHLN